MKKLNAALTILMLSAGAFTACSGNSDSLARAEKETQAQWGLTFYESEAETKSGSEVSTENETEKETVITEAAEGVNMLAVEEMEIQAVSPVNVRSGPGADFDKKGTLQVDQTVILTGICDNGWVQVLMNDETGYVSAQYVQASDESKNMEDILKEAESILASSTDSEDEAESSSEETEKETKKETAEETKKETKEESQAGASDGEDTTAENLAWSTIDVNVRKGPGASYDSVGILKQKQSVKVLDSSDAWWWKVEFNGQEAYISVQYLTTDKPE